MSKKLTPLDYFIALGQTCLMQSKNYKNNEVVVLKNGEKHTTQELGGIVETALKAFEIIKENKIDVYSFIKNDYDTYKDYLHRMCILNFCDESNIFEKCWGILTEEEFDLLKECYYEL